MHSPPRPRKMPNVSPNDLLEKSQLSHLYGIWMMCKSKSEVVWSHETSTLLVYKEVGGYLTRSARIAALIPLESKPLLNQLQGKWINDKKRQKTYICVEKDTDCGTIYRFFIFFVLPRKCQAQGGFDLCPILP